MLNDTDFVKYVAETYSYLVAEAVRKLEGMSVEQYLALVKKHYGDGVMGDLLTALGADLQFTKKFVLNEHHLYGSSRLGVKTHKRVLLRKEFSISGFEEDGTYIVDEVTDSLVYVVSSEYFCRVLAQKQYELSNHLGNVLATVLDRRTGVFDEGADTLMYYVADVVNATLYYPFGSSMMSYSNEEFGYKYGWNTQESVDEIKGVKNHYTAPFWEYDPRVVHRWNLDPKPNPSFSPYAINQCNPIWFSDPLGDTIRVEGSKRDIRTFTRQLSRTTGNKYGVDDNGILYNKRGSDNTETTKRKSGELSGIVRNVMDDEEVFQLDLTRNDPNTLIDSYDRGTVDVGDFKKMSRIMKAGQFAHFLTERMENPGGYSMPNRTDANFTISHDRGLEAESRVVTSMLGIPYLKVVQVDDLRPIRDESGNVTGYFFRATSTYGNVVYGFDYGARIVPADGGRSRVEPTGIMLSRFKRKK